MSACAKCGNELSTGDAPNSAVCWGCLQKGTFEATGVASVEMVRVPNTELARLIAVAAVFDDKWPESVKGMDAHLSPAMCERLRETGLRLLEFASSAERKRRLGL